MNKPTLVNIGTTLAMKSIEWGLPFAETLTKKTIYEQFCGGTTLLDASPAIENLARYNSKTILDYGVEAKESEEDFNRTMVENLNTIDFASRSAHIPFISVKITGIARFDLLARIQQNAPLTHDEQNEYFTASKRLDAICHAGREKGVNVLIDAEESWIQDTIDRMANMMMARYNRDKAVVFNTFQMYRHDRLAFLKESHELAQEKSYVLGAKLVRGAYMEKERKRAAEMGYPTPINPDKVATDKMYNDALVYSIQNHEQIAVMNATHNAQSSMLLADLMEEMGIARDHPHFWFCQLYGMSDNISFNLAAAGYNVAKYMVYGMVRDVVPYLARRAQENTSVTGDVSRELALIEKEVKRRGL
ncbi:MAG: proline dehydrogenase family protein [Saprospiraceae bacterium]|nr:proline dehydrogenase family protein [Saprospiraceae bacterium]